MSRCARFTISCTVYTLWCVLTSRRVRRRCVLMIERAAVLGLCAVAHACLVVCISPGVFTCEPALIVCGDFNSTPGSAMYAYMTRGPSGIDLSGIDRGLYVCIRLFVVYAGRLCGDGSRLGPTDLACMAACSHAGSA
jgi:hypothetical protein